MEFPQPPDVWTELGRDGYVSQLRHLQKPGLGDPDQPAKRVALSYLAEAAHLDLLPLSSQDLEYLAETISDSPAPRNAGFRWLPNISISRSDDPETIIVLVQQTVVSKDMAIDVGNAGIRIVLHEMESGRRWAVTSVNSTARKHTDLDEAFERTSAELFNPISEVVIAMLGEALHLNLEVLRNADIRLLAYNMEELRLAVGKSVERGDRTTLSPVYRVDVNLGTSLGEKYTQRIYYDPVRQNIVSRRELISNCTGLVFSLDPVSTSHDLSIRPNSYVDKLNKFRQTIELNDLAPSAGGTRELSGPRVMVANPNPLGFDPPQQVMAFDFPSRTNDFAAVSAYAHCDAMMGIVEEFGFDLHAYFSTVRMPVTLVHRAPIIKSPCVHDGRCVGAHVVPWRQSKDDPWTIEMKFALADLSDWERNPLGVSADVRWVWHEFCHVLLMASTGELEFKFGHSAGDALAAIICDPESQFTDASAWRGITFPFVTDPMRRHDRSVKLGWGWGGSLYDAPPNYPNERDPAGYRAEQILSSTLFHLYRAAGGDALQSDGRPDRGRRRAAAHYVSYLIVRAISSLGPAATVPAETASVFATALMEADIATRIFDSLGSVRRGGTLHKVIRWAFEKQGLYQQANASPLNEPGDPEPIDIYIENSAQSGGEYGFFEKWHANTGAIWVRRAPDDYNADQAPSPSRENYIYVTVCNRGAANADAFVDVLTRIGGDSRTWEKTAGVWQPAVPAADAVVRSEVPAGACRRFGPFRWTPQGNVRNVLLARATAPGDRSNADPDSLLACAEGPTPVDHLVRFDNNLGYREWML